MEKLKDLVMFVLGVGVQLFIWVSTVIPFMGMFFVALMATSALLAIFANHAPGAIIALSYGWKIYLAMVVYVLFVMTTITYLHCCYSTRTFVGHLGHEPKKHLANLMTALGWPVMLYANDVRTRDEWCEDWTNYLFYTLEYWCTTVNEIFHSEAT